MTDPDEAATSENTPPELPVPPSSDPKDPVTGTTGNTTGEAQAQENARNDPPG